MVAHTATNFYNNSTMSKSPLNVEHEGQKDNNVTNSICEKFCKLVQDKLL